MLPMTQGYFGCCSLRDPRIVGSWRSPSATCALFLPVHRQAIQAPRMRLVCPTHRLGRPSARWPRPGAWPVGVACPAPGVRNPSGRASSLALRSCRLQPLHMPPPNSPRLFWVLFLIILQKMYGVSSMVLIILFQFTTDNNNTNNNL
jgi:hypothetical protein